MNYFIYAYKIIYKCTNYNININVYIYMFVSC